MIQEWNIRIPWFRRLELDGSPWNGWRASCGQPPYQDAERRRSRHRAGWSTLTSRQPPAAAAAVDHCPSTDHWLQLKLSDQPPATSRTYCAVSETSLDDVDDDVTECRHWITSLVTSLDFTSVDDISEWRHLVKMYGWRHCTISNRTENLLTLESILVTEPLTLWLLVAISAPLLTVGVYEVWRSAEM